MQLVQTENNKENVVDLLRTLCLPIVLVSLDEV